MRAFANPKQKRSAVRDVPSRRRWLAPSGERGSTLRRAEIRHILHGPRFQPQLTVGVPDNEYEREAERTAGEIIDPASGRGPTSVSPAPPSIQRDLTPPGNCIQGIHDDLQRLVKAWCDHPSGRACTAGESCHRLRQKIRRNQLCAQHRRTINNRCYDGGNQGHRIAERDARLAQANCMALYRANCERRRERVTERVPVNEPVAHRIAEWAKQVMREGRDPFEAAEEFLRNNPALVGVIVAAGIAAIIVLVADDATLVGIADDVLIPIIGALEWVALRMSFGF